MGGGWWVVGRDSEIVSRGERGSGCGIGVRGLGFRIVVKITNFKPKNIIYTNNGDSAFFV